MKLGTGLSLVCISRGRQPVTQVHPFSSAASRLLSTGFHAVDPVLQELLAMDSKKKAAPAGGAAGAAGADPGAADAKKAADAGGSFDIGLPGAEMGKVGFSWPQGTAAGHSCFLGTDGLWSTCRVPHMQTSCTGPCSHGWMKQPRTFACMSAAWAVTKNVR